MELTCCHRIAAVLRRVGSVLWIALVGILPGPAVAASSFADVSATSWASPYIEAIRTAGITTGCGGTNYCPAAAVTRDQMAAFLVRAIEGEPASGCTEAPFSDVPVGNAFCRYVQRLAALNITTGCGGGNYCPGQVVDRQQLAAFIVRALDGEPASTYCDSGAPFSDVPSTNAMCKYIKRLAELQVTTGCDATHYCPNQAVTREQMAAFLARAFLGVRIAIAPKSAVVPSGATQQFSATVTGTANTAVTWSIQEAATGGSVSNGTYQAPTTISGASQTFHVVATSQADPSKSAVATVTVTTPGTPATVYSGCAAPTTPQHIYYSDPVNGSMANDGSQAHPWASLSAMVAAGKLPPATGATVASGDRIVLLSGNHGSISLNNAVNSDFISIEAAPGQIPVLGGITIYGGSHWAFSGLTIQNLNNGGYTFGVRYTGDNFVFANSTVLSQPDVSAWTQADWRQKALYSGVNGQGNCLAITNNTIRNVAFAVGVGGSNVLVRGNTIDHFGDDGIDFAQGTGMGTISNIEISRNVITNNLDIGDNNHNDGIQGWVLNGTTGTNVLIDSNRVIAQTTPALPWASTMQGISEFDGAWDGIQITNNVVIATAYHGIALYGAHNSTIINNTVFGNYVAPNGDVNQTWIGVFSSGGSPPVNVVVRNNISSSYAYVNTGITSDHNVVTTNPQANFVQFNRATFQYDLHPAPGSEQLGYGSTQLAPAYDITGAQRVPPVTAGAYQ